MSRQTYVLHNEKTRTELLKLLTLAPRYTRVEVADPVRSTDQNAKLWAVLSEIARQKPTHNGVKMNPELWKAVFMQALGCEMVMLPTLNGDGFFPLGHRSSKLTVAEFSNLLELIHAWAAQNAVILHESEEVVG